MWAIADDLTGAAEIAAIGHRRGWRGDVVLRWPAKPESGTLTVLDTDTRLGKPEDAGDVITVAGQGLAGKGAGLVFKKTDSVLRGPVLAEVSALAAVLGRRRVLLVPANPSLGRVIRDGRYYIGGVPLHETAFASDPHHPARRAEIGALLGSDRVAVVEPGDPLPAEGVVVGAASSAEDVARWAQRVDDGTLPAGGRDFFAAILRARGLERAPRENDFLPPAPTLLVRGSLAPQQPLADVLTLPAEAVAGGVDARREWIRSAVVRLKASRFLAVACPRSPSPEAPRHIRDAYAELAGALVAGMPVAHLMIEGGATAAAILRALGWTQLTVLREWEPGVATLQPSAQPDFAVTMRPGSYTWPAALWSHVITS